MLNNCGIVFLLLKNKTKNSDLKNIFLIVNSTLILKNMGNLEEHSVMSLTFPCYYPESYDQRFAAFP